MENQTSKWKTWHKVVLGIIGFFLSMIMIGMSSDDTSKTNSSEAEAEEYSIEKEETKDWSSLNLDQKAVYLREVIKESPDDLMILQGYVEESIQNKCAFPLETDIEGLNFMSKIQIDDTEKGYLYAMGTGTTKNAFGMKIAFKWLARLNYTTKDHSIKEINIF